MIFRRGFLQLGLAAGAGSLLPLSLHAGMSGGGTGAGLPLLRLIHDPRQDASLSLARSLGQQLLGSAQAADALLLAVDGDVTRFWTDELQPAWRQRRSAVAGTSAPDILFCLEQLARDHQLRVIWRQQQDGAGDQSLVSWLIAAA